MFLQTPRGPIARIVPIRKNVLCLPSSNIRIGASSARSLLACVFRLTWERTRFCLVEEMLAGGMRPVETVDSARVLWVAPAVTCTSADRRKFSPVPGLRFRGERNTHSLRCRGTSHDVQLFQVHFCYSKNRYTTTTTELERGCYF